MSARGAVPPPGAVPTPRDAGLGALLADAVSAAAFAGGFGSLLLVVRGQEDRPLDAFLTALAFCALFLLASRRRWLLPALLAACAAAAAAAVTAASAWPAVLDAAGALFREAQLLLLFGRADPRFVPALRALVLLPLAAVASAFVRRWGGLPPAAIVSSAAAVPYLLWYPDRPGPVLLLAAACALLLPRRLVSRIRRRRPDEAPLSRAPLQLLAIPTVALALALALGTIPADTSSWRSPLLLNQLGDWQLEGMGRLGLVRAWASFGLGNYGFLPQGARLGGPVVLSDARAMDVRTEAPGLMRGAVLTVYTGDAWTSPAPRQYRLGALRWRSVQDAAFQADLLDSAEGRAFLKAYARTVRTDIEVRSGFEAVIYTNGRLRSVVGMDPFNPAYFTGDGDVFTFTPRSDLTSYRTDSVVLDRSLPGFAAAVAALAAHADGRDDRRFEEAAAACLQLPEGLPASVAEAAQAAAGEETDPYLRALALLRFFSEGFTYTLSAPLPPAGEDFVAAFLADRRGYCLYYATAMAVMARTLGIPSRLVEGFALAPEPEGAADAYVATGRTAHAWCELYFRGVGWLAFDPTPQVGDGTPLPTPSPTAAETPGAPSPTAGPDATETPTPSPSPGGEATGGIAALLGLLVAGALGTAAGGAVRLRARRLLDHAYVARRLPDPSERLEHLYADLRAQLACLDLRPETGETLRAFAARAEASLRIDGRPVPEALGCVEALRYGGIAPSPDDLDRLEALRGALERRLRASLSPAAYFARQLRMRRPSRGRAVPW